MSKIKDIITQEGPVLKEVFMVKQAISAASSNNSIYLALTLQDSSGTIEARKWNISQDEIDICTTGSLVRVTGMMQFYRDHPQLKINEIEPVDESVYSQDEMQKFIPVAPVSIEKLKERLSEYIGMIEDKDLHDLTLKIITDNYDKYTTYPAAVTVHHAYMGGLLFHSLSICSMAIKVAERYQYLKKDYLIAGSILHDIGKTREFSGYKATAYTVEGNLIGHIVIGAMIVHEYGEKMNIPQEKLTVLTHMILSHHGKLEFGSPKVPMTSEAYILHLLDDMDSKTELLRTTYETTKEGDFTGKIPWLEGVNFYKPGDLNSSEN